MNQKIRLVELVARDNQYYVSGSDKPVIPEALAGGLVTKVAKSKEDVSAEILEDCANIKKSQLIPKNANSYIIGEGVSNFSPLPIEEWYTFPVLYCCIKTD